MSDAPTPPERLHTDVGALSNAVSGLGMRGTKSAETRVDTARERLSMLELDALWQKSGLIKRMAAELAADASSPPRIECASIDVNALRDALDELNAAKMFVRAAMLANHYGGAAVWMVLDGADPSLPLSGRVKVRGEYQEVAPQSWQRIDRLVVIDRFELSASSGYVCADPKSAHYGLPEIYTYTATNSAKTFRIHADHLIRFFGDPLPPRIAALYDYWGAPIMEALFESYTAFLMTRNAGSEIAQEVGMMLYKLDNLSELLSSDQGRVQLHEWFRTQQAAKSSVRANIVGQGQEARRETIQLSGWTDIYDRLAQFLASERGWPLSKLYGQAPGGLSTDDAAGERQWSRQVENYQTETLRPAYNLLLDRMFRASEGPTQGDVPDTWQVEFEPYTVPTASEEATTASMWATVLTSLDNLGVLEEEELRATVEQLPGLALLTDDELAHMRSSYEARVLPGLLATAQAKKTGEGEGEPDQQASEVAPAAPGPTRSLTGDAIDDTFIPPQGVRDNARRALEVRAKKPPSQRGMTPVGLARARDLSNGRPASLNTLRRMAAYFTRHEVDKDGETWGEQGKGWQAWQGWGGDEGWRWARTEVERADRHEDALRIDPYQGPDDDLPDHVMALPEEERDLWARTWNVTFKRTRDEGRSFALANASIGHEEGA